MKKLTLIFIIAPFILPAQNLVPNWNFSANIKCPNYFNQVTYSTAWKNCKENNDGINACDYCNACGGDSDGYSFSVPSNFWGYQNAASGDAYMALATTALNLQPDYRENIYCQLSQPLSIGTTYYLSLKVSKSDVTQNATNRMGIKLATDSIFPINNFSQLYSTDVISDTEQWTTISGSFIADSAYRYVAVGNFYDNANTTITNVCSGCAQVSSIYLFDDICVTSNPEEDCSVFENSIETIKAHTQPIDFYLYEDAGSLHTIISNSQYQELTFKLINSVGQLILSSTFKPTRNNEDISTPVSQLPAGVYMVIIYNQDSGILKKFIHE